MLRGGLRDEEILEQIQRAVMEKTRAHDFGNVVVDSEKRKMVQIGG